MFCSRNASRSATARRVYRGKQSRRALAALALGLLVTHAQAGPISFDIAGAPGSAVDASVDPVFCLGCSVTTTLKSGLDAITFSLAQGESHTFDFFKIRVGGLGGATIDITATLGFDLPFGMSATGNADGWYATILGKVSGGALAWNDLPTILTAADGAQFSVDFSDVAGFTIGNSAWVQATVTAIAEAAPPVDPQQNAVSEPATLAMLGLGLFGIAALRRRAAAVR